MNEFKKLIRSKTTQNELADYCGVTETSMCRYLDLQRKVPLHVFMRMCKKLNIQSDELYNTYLFAWMSKRVSAYREKEGE